MLTMQAFYKKLSSKSAASKTYWHTLLRLTRASRVQLLNLKSDEDWVIWHSNKAPITAK